MAKFLVIERVTANYDKMTHCREKSWNGDMPSLIAQLQEEAVFGDERQAYEDSRALVAKGYGDIADIIVVPIDAAIFVELASIRAEHNNKMESLRITDKLAQDRADYERLKAQFEGTAKK